MLSRPTTIEELSAKLNWISKDPTGEQLRQKIARCNYSEDEDADAIVAALLERGFKLIKMEKHK